MIVPNSYKFNDKKVQRTFLRGFKRLFQFYSLPIVYSHFTVKSNKKYIKISFATYLQFFVNYDN